MRCRYPTHKRSNKGKPTESIVKGFCVGQLGHFVDSKSKLHIIGVYKIIIKHTESYYYKPTV